MRGRNLVQVRPCSVVGLADERFCACFHRMLLLRKSTRAEQGFCGGADVKDSAVEGRETAAQYERRVTKQLKERQERDKVIEDRAVQQAQGLNLDTHEDCVAAANLLGEALSECKQRPSHISS